MSDNYLENINLPEKDYAIYLSKWYFEKTNSSVDFNNPQTFNEKIQWLKLYDSTDFKTMTTDKYQVRDWVKRQIGEEYLIPLLGVYDKFSDINFNNLPKSFVIKCNHGSGWNYIVKDKSKINIQELKNKFDKWMSTNFAFLYGFELHYKDIVPKIIIEKYIENNSGTLFDYKIWCFNGEPKFIQFRDDWKSNLKMAFYDLAWNKQPFYYDHDLYQDDLEKPDNLDEMISIAKKLCKNQIFVCVDLYRLDNGKIYFGEMTYTRSTGIANWFPKKWNKKIGNLIKLPKNKEEIMQKFNYTKLSDLKSQKVKISIIVPVYNAEPYLESCLNSLLSQTLDNIEIICINDGSTDQSKNILETYSKLNSKIKFFNQKNLGPAKARNLGLDKATGEFIMFCDADDTYTSTMCEDMYNAINKYNVDLVMCNTQGYNRNGKKVSNGYYFPFVEGRNFLSQDMKFKINVFLWNKIFRRTKIDIYKINFPDEHKADDNYFVFLYLMCSENVYFLDKKLYNHFDRENSIMDVYKSHKIQYADVKDKIDIIEILYNTMIKNNIFEKNIQSFNKIFCNELLYAWVNVPKIWEKKFLTRVQEFLSLIPSAHLNLETRFDILFKNIQEYNFYEAINLLDLFLQDIKRERRKYIKQEIPEPAFNQNNITIIFNCDNAFAKYLSVTIQSIILNSSMDKNYDIIILNQDISESNCEIIKQQIINRNNFSIRFYNMDTYNNTYQVSKWFTQNHIKSAAYYRLFIFDIFRKFKKAIYLDADLIVNTDIAHLYNIPIDDNIYCLAVKDSYISMLTPKEEFVFPNICQYAKDILGMDNLNDYFNSGVMLFDIEKVNNNYTLKDFITVAKKNNKYFHDQNVLNSLFYKHTKLIDNSWNVQLNSGNSFIENCHNSIDNIKIFHFCSKYKPWLVIKKTYSYIWWQYAQKSPFYSEILATYICKIVSDIKVKVHNNDIQDKNINLIKQALYYKNYKWNYYRCKLLANLTFGKMRKHYKDKKKKLKAKIKAVKQFLKEK